MKQYVKPDLFFEHYELNQQIAACRWDMNQASGAECVAFQDMDMNGKHSSGVVLFTDKSRCNMLEDVAPDYCYTTGTDPHMKLFNS